MRGDCTGHSPTPPPTRHTYLLSQALSLWGQMRHRVWQGQGLGGWVNGRQALGR